MNFDPVAVACTQFAKYLWMNESERTISRAHEFVKQMKINVNSKNKQPFAKTNSDKINHGVFDSNNKRLPATSTAHMDNCLYA